MKDYIETIKSLATTLEEAEKKAKLKDFSNKKEHTELRNSVLGTLSAIEGKRLYIGEEKNVFSSEPFVQGMQRNIDFLNQINYLTTAECGFLWKIQAYLEFKSNVIICREDKFPTKTRKSKKQKLMEEPEEEEKQIKLPKAATVTDMSKILGESRKNVSKILQSLKEKEIVLNPEGAGKIEVNGRVVSPRTWIVNPYILICAPRRNEVELDILTMRLFQHSLKNIKDDRGNKLKLPARFF